MKSGWCGLEEEMGNTGRPDNACETIDANTGKIEVST